MATCGALMGGSAAYCGYRIGKGIVNCCRGRNLTPKPVEVILDNTTLYNNITEIITKEYVIMNEIQSY